MADFDAAGGGKFLAAYVVSDDTVDIEKLNAFILERKPPYMVPAATMQIDRIPLNQNQKVNKKALPVPERKAEEMVAPQNETLVPCAYVLSKVMGITGIWISFPIAELLTLLYILFVAKGKISNIYQISEEEPAILDISFLGKEAMGAESSRQVMDFLGKHGMENKLSNKIGIAIEEMVENIYQHSGEKKVDIDLRLVVSKEDVVLSFCDDGPEFDPTTYQSEEKEEFAIDNIMMLRAISKKMEYQRVIGLNKTTVFI